MPIDGNLDELPRGRPEEPKGWAPDPTVRFGSVLVAKWYADEQARPDDRLARFRHSDAGACARAVAYAALKVTETDPIDEPGVFITRLGQEIHAAWQGALVERYRHVEVEASVVYENEDGQRERGGHIDAVVPWLDDDADPEPITRLSSIEYKSVGGFRYKKAIGCPPAARHPQGPDYSHILQAALNAKAKDADEAVIVYATREAVSKEAAERNNIPDDRRVVAEWTMNRETYTRYADLEIQRITGILALVDRGELPKRMIPDPELPLRHLIVNPLNGTWVENDENEYPIDGGTTWHCNYCRYQTLCSMHPATRCSIDDVELTP